MNQWTEGCRAPGALMNDAGNNLAQQISLELTEGSFPTDFNISIPSFIKRTEIFLLETSRYSPKPRLFFLLFLPIAIHFF